jgi:hypothetical protein
MAIPMGIVDDITTIQRHRPALNDDVEALGGRRTLPDAGGLEWCRNLLAKPPQISRRWCTEEPGILAAEL